MKQVLLEIEEIQFLQKNFIWFLHKESTVDSNNRFNCKTNSAKKSVKNVKSIFVYLDLRTFKIFSDFMLDELEWEFIIFVVPFRIFLKTKFFSINNFFLSFCSFSGSISNIGEGTYFCKDGSTPALEQRVISGVLGAASSVTSIQVANLLRLFRIPQVSKLSL